MSTDQMTFTPAANTNSVKSIEISNSGQNTLTFKSPVDITSDGTFSSTTNCSSSLAPGQFCQVQVTFYANNANTHTGVLNIKTNVGNANVSLSGTTQMAVLAFNPVSGTNFGSVAIGSSANLAFKLTNSGSIAQSDINLQNMLYGGGVSITQNTCGTYGFSLAAGASCDITVTFAPQSTYQNGSGSISIQTNSAPYFSSNYNLSGTVGYVSINMPYSNSMQFYNIGVGSSSVVSYTINNTGNMAANAGYVTTPSDNHFVISSGCGTASNPVTLSAGGSCTFTVTFTPTSVASYNSTLTYTSPTCGGNCSSSMGGGYNAISLYGTGAQGTLYGSPVGGAGASINQTYQVNVQVSNMGQASVNISSVTLDAAATSAGFTIASSTCGSTLGAYGGCSVTLNITPTAYGYYAGNLVVLSNASNPTLNLSVGINIYEP